MPRIEPIPWEYLPDDQKREIELSRASGASSASLASQVLAYSSAALRSMKRAHGALFREGVIEPRLQELLRLRSAILNGCASCAAARKENTVTEDDVACLIDFDNEGLSKREQLALAFLEQLSRDHWSIDEATFTKLAEVFSTAEIVELGWRCTQAIAAHRFIHCLDMLGDGAPVIPFDPSQIDRTTAPLASPALAPAPT